MLLHTTQSLCRVCKEALPARVEAREHGVWMTKACPDHGPQELRIAASADWYTRTRAWGVHRPKPTFTRPIDLGCPYDCGPCTQHQVDLAMPVVTITSACNLDCPICYVHNKNDGAYHMSVEDFRAVLRHVKARKGGDLDLINLTGGEPMLHPRFLELLAIARDEGVRRVTICSNGLKLRDEALVEKLAELGARVALSFDSFDPVIDVAMQGVALLPAKLRCLDLLDKHGVDCTLIPVVTNGYNDHEIGTILDLAMARTCVRHVEVHLMTYTGQGGAGFDRSGRITLDEVLARISAQLRWIDANDFVPSPRAHPLCYQVAYLLLDPEGDPIPFARLIPPAELYACLGDTLYLEPTPRLEAALKDAIDRLWVAGEERPLRLLKRLLADAFGTNDLRAAEKHVKAIYVHAHMDEEGFDVERLAACCDANCTPDGATVPVCAYNVLYREKDPNFMTQARTWGPRARGHQFPENT
jgi:uncharacterized radical SAM superfamily Fe-S cluster-containing enzyme